MKYVIIPIYGILCFILGLWLGGIIAQPEAAPQPNYCMELTQGQMPEVCK